MYIARQANPADILKLHNQHEDTIFDDIGDVTEDEDDEFDEQTELAETINEQEGTGDSDIDEKENNFQTDLETKTTDDSEAASDKKEKVIKRPRGTEYKLIRYNNYTVCSWNVRLN